MSDVGEGVAAMVFCDACGTPILTWENMRTLDVMGFHRKYHLDCYLQVLRNAAELYEKLTGPEDEFKAWLGEEE